MGKEAYGAGLLIKPESSYRLQWVVMRLDKSTSVILLPVSGPQMCRIAVFTDIQEASFVHNSCASIQFIMAFPGWFKPVSKQTRLITRVGGKKLVYVTKASYVNASLAL